MKTCNHCLNTRGYWEEKAEEFIIICKEHDFCINDQEEPADECDYYISNGDDEEDEE